MKLRIELGDVVCECILSSVDDDSARKAVSSFFNRIIHRDKIEPPQKYQIMYRGHVDGRKIEVIKEIRFLTSLGLKEAKDASENFGSVLATVTGGTERDRWLSALRRAGAEVEGFLVE